MFWLDNKKGTNREQSAGNKNINQDRVGNKNKNNVGTSNDNSSKGTNNKKDMYINNFDKKY